MSRVPVDLWVRLNHEDFEDDFDADGVDLSPGGLALKSDYLPEIGDRLRCRFDDPDDESELVVDGEVVWAHDAGERSGEFGLRFTSVDGSVEDGLRRLVEHLGGQPGERVRLHLDGVASPIDADLVERDEGWLTAEQELPFLELGMGVAAQDGSRGRLASVDLRLEGGVPRLVLGVELDELEAPSANDVETLDEPEPEDEPDAGSTYDDELLEAANDATMQDVLLPEALAEAAEEAPIDEGREAQQVKVFEVAQDDAPAADETHEEDEELLAEAPREGVAAKLAPAVARSKRAMADGWAKTRPALAALWQKTVAFVALVGSKAGPGLRSFFGKLKALGAVLWGKVRKSKPKRRTTAMPKAKRVAGAPRRRQRGGREEVAPPRRKNRRIVAMSVLAFVAVGAAVYAFAGGEEVEATPPADAAPAQPAAEPVERSDPEPAPAAAPAAQEEPAAGEAPAEASAGEVAEEPAGGPLAEPSYPTLRDAQPSSGGPVSEGQAFGADSVEEGRSATIRMSQPVETLRGQVNDDGFTVTVPGALALDRAAPIAAANPAVERAMILNRGDHAVLTVRFVAGRSPEYRVVARGRAIEVIIER